MGAVPTKQDTSQVLTVAGALHDASLVPGAVATMRFEQLGFFSRFVSVCNAQRGVVLQRYVADGFQQEIGSTIARVRENWERTGSRGMSSRSVYYEVLDGGEADVKRFRQHMRGLEAISFLNLPSVTVPRAAVAVSRGVTIACMSLHHLQGPVTPDVKSVHISVVRAVLGKVLRTKGDPAVQLYDGGDGTLVAVDASFLLPLLALPGVRGIKATHHVRPELAIARDCLWTPTPAGTTAWHQSPVAAPTPYLSAVTASAPSSKKRPSPVQALHAVLAVGCGDIRAADDSFRTVSVATRPALEYAPSHSYEGTSAVDYQGVTQIVTQVALAAVVERIETLGGDFDVSDVLHSAGLGMHMIGAVWNAMSGHAAPSARQRLAVEMVARAGKHWLATHLATTSEAASHATMLELFRSVHDSSFVETEIAPIILQRYGATHPPVQQTTLPLRLISARLSVLTGVSVSGGAVVSVAPRIIVARSSFSLSSQQELALSTVAVRRDDPMGVASILAAGGIHSRTHARITNVIAQLRSRRLDNPVLQMFVSCVELAAVETHLRCKVVSDAVNVLDNAVSTMLELVFKNPAASTHDALFVTRHGLRLVGFLTRLHRAPDAHAYMVQLLELGALGDHSRIGVVACRQMLEEYYRAATEAFAHRGEDALKIAQTWARICPALFGSASPQQCRATKLYLVSLIRCRRHQEALAIAREYMELALRAYGPRDAHAAMAMNDVATLTWRRDPNRGLVLYQQALDVFRHTPAGAQQVAPTLYNMGLAATRVNKLRQSLGYFKAARDAAVSNGDRNTVSSCERMSSAVVDIAATKIQRWVRDCMYGIAPSQTSRTDLCSTLTWSDKDDVASTAGEIMHTTAVLGGVSEVKSAADSDDAFGSETTDR